MLKYIYIYINFNNKKYYLKIFLNKKYFKNNYYLTP